MQPISRRRVATLAVLAFLILASAGSVRLIGFAGRAVADEPVDAPRPDLSPKELAAKVREAMKPYDGIGSIKIVFTETDDTNWKFDSNQGSSPEEQKPILVTFRGRARYESDRSRCAPRIRFDESHVGLDSAFNRPMVLGIRRC